MDSWGSGCSLAFERQVLGGDMKLFGPPPRSFHVCYLGTVCLVGAAGCRESILPPDTTRSGVQQQAPSLGPPQAEKLYFRGMNARFKALAGEVPGFTGWFADEHGEFVISVATDQLSSQSEERLVDWAKRYFDPGYSKARIRTRRVKYDFLTLARRYQDIHAAIVPSENLITATGLDGKRGLITIGVRSMNETGPFRARIASLGIPEDMVDLEEQPVAIANTTLNQRFRPAIGGLQIVNSEGRDCTIGFNVMRYDTGTNPYTSPIYFWTAGHCSTNWGVASGSAWWQPTGFLAVNVVGNEYEVVPKRTGASCPPTKSPCIAADVVVARYPSTMTFPDSVRYGWVANVNSSKEIIGQYNVQGSSVGGLQGQSVTMVGQESGKRLGVISLICQDKLVANPTVPGENIWVLCMDRATYYATDGDSGAPVFIPYHPDYPLTPAIVGIHSASGGLFTRWFSSFSAIDDALNHAYFIW